MAELKTKKNSASVIGFLKKTCDKKRLAECKKILKLMQAETKAKPKMWGASMIGFGDYHYKYASGREGNWFITGFSPRKQALTLYLMCDVNLNKALIKKLGKCKTGRGCIYVKHLEDVDLNILKKLVQKAVKRAKK